MVGSLQRCLIRHVVVTRGHIRLRARCRPRPDYARVVPAAGADDGGVRFEGGGVALHLSGCVNWQLAEGEAHADFALEAGEDAYFVLRDAGDPAPSREQVESSIRLTIQAWRRWARRSNYRGRWREMVTRSALTLKLLTSHEHGSIAAAATFALPEAPGGERNWDYRATWIRDATFTLYALMRLGYTEEAEQFRLWMGRRVRHAADRQGQLRIMYALDGSQAADETALDHLAGYGGARPVRIGNAAHEQVQLDIYGELMDAVYLGNKYGNAISREGWEQLSRIVEYVIAHWREPDAGIWEVRDEPRHFLHSRLMCWVALDRALRLAHKRSLPVPLVRWQDERDRIADDIWQNFRHPDLGHFVQHRGGTGVDAALLMMPLVRFVSATDPVWLATLDAIHDELSDDGFLFRYRGEDGLAGEEGAFTTCTFWMVECLARANRLDDAQLLMEKALAHANHLGLYSEELSLTGDALGNFPQGLTHLALISAAYFLDRRLADPAGATWQP